MENMFFNNNKINRIYENQSLTTINNLNFNYKNLSDNLIKINNKNINYKNVSLLKNFITKFGKIKSRRETHLSLKLQRKLSKVIRRSRDIKLLPFTLDLKF